MTRVEATATIEAPPERVWEYVGDLERVPEWAQTRLFGFLRVGTLEMLSIDGTPVGEGTTYRERGGFGPVTFESEWRITDWEPPRQQVHRSEFAGTGVTLRIRLDPTADGTVYRQSVELGPVSGWRPLGRWGERLLARWLVAPSLRGIVEHLKATVEAGSH